MRKIMAIVCVMFVLCLSCSICSARNLQYIMDSSDHESALYLDTDSIRMAEIGKPNCGMVFRVFDMKSFYDRQAFLYMLTQNRSFEQYELLAYNDWSYVVDIYEHSNSDGAIRLICEEFYNSNDELIFPMRFGDPQYKLIANNYKYTMIFNAAARYFIDHFDYIKTLPYYDFESDSYKELQ